MKSKLLKKLRRRFTDTHKVERERKTLGTLGEQKGDLQNYEFLRLCTSAGLSVQ